MPNEYVFVDEWDVDAPPEVVYDVIADARTCPEWWKPVYLSVEGDERETHHRAVARAREGLEPYARMRL